MRTNIDKPLLVSFLIFFFTLFPNYIFSNYDLLGWDSKSLWYIHLAIIFSVPILFLIVNIVNKNIHRRTFILTGVYLFLLFFAVSLANIVSMKLFKNYYVFSSASYGSRDRETINVNLTDEDLRQIRLLAYDIQSKSINIYSADDSFRELNYYECTKAGKEIQNSKPQKEILGTKYSKKCQDKDIVLTLRGYNSLFPHQGDFLIRKIGTTWQLIDFLGYYIGTIN